MPTFVFAYRMPTDYVPGPDTQAAWTAWFDSMGESMPDPGNPVFESAELGNCGDGTRLGGYSFVTADALEAAVALAKGSPALEAGGGVEVGVVTDSTSARSRAAKAWRETELMAALHVTGPAGEHADKLILFGRFVGSWNLEWIGTDTNGQPATMTGELHFGWVLGGRAVQDVWIVPGRGQLGEGRPPMAFHGSTIRFYDSAIDAWRSTWIDPVSGRVRRFIGRAADGDVVLLSDEDDPQLRWRFTDITADSFTWRGESSHDGGATWHLDEQMLATRDNRT